MPSSFENIEDDEFIKIRKNCTLFLGYTSNMASCGVRESIRYDDGLIVNEVMKVIYIFLDI